MTSPTLLAPLALAAALSLSSPPSSQPVAGSERTVLRALEAPGLAGLRGGDRGSSDVLGVVERDALTQAQATAPDLADLRGRGLSDRELKIIGITVLVVVVIAILV